MPEIAKRIITTSLSKKRKAPKMKSVPYPKSIEREYLMGLKLILTELQKQIETHVLRLLEPVAKDVGQEIKKDANIGDIPQAIQAVKESMTRKYSEKELAYFAKQKGLSVAEYNKSKMGSELKRVIGVDILGNDLALKGMTDIFTTMNVSLIKNLVNDATNKVESTILNGFSSGTRWEEISKDVQKIIDPNEGTVSSRAKLIARDQISKLNGQVTQERQRSLGVSKYIWRTSMDERVRDSHRELEGQVFSWDNPPEVGHPGEDYQCRCTAEPDLSTFLD